MINKTLLFIILIAVFIINPDLSNANQNNQSLQKSSKEFSQNENIFTPNKINKQKNKIFTSESDAEAKQNYSAKENREGQSLIKDKEYELLNNLITAINKKQDKESIIFDVLKSLFIAIIGGLSLYYLPKSIQYVRARKYPILTYQFDEDGTDDKPQKRACHNWGQSVDDKDASNGRAWQHTSQHIHDKGWHTCYGPYTKEIPFRGKYRANFKIKAKGIKNKEEYIILLDVTYGNIDYTDGKVTRLGFPLVEKKLYGKNFTENKYMNFEVDFDYDGQSFIEFRCLVQSQEDYKAHVDEIFFDNIEVYALKDIF